MGVHTVPTQRVISLSTCVIVTNFSEDTHTTMQTHNSNLTAQEWPSCKMLPKSLSSKPMLFYSSPKATEDS